MNDLYVVKRTDREVYKDKKNQNVTRIEQAHKTTLQKATNMLSGVKASERILWNVYSVDELSTPQVIHSVAVVSEEKLNIIKNTIDDKDKLLGMTEDICSAFAAINKVKQEALCEQSKMDLALSDIYHFIEFTDNLNLAQTYKVMQLLKSVLQKRRKIKNTISIASLYDKCTSQTIANGELKKEVGNLFDRQYTNRVLKDLSDIVTMKKEEFSEYLHNEFLEEV